MPESEGGLPLEQRRNALALTYNVPATDLKLFPAATYGPRHLKALKSVLPKHVRVYPVGGIGSQDIAEWLASGADGFGFGSELFAPAYTLAEIEKRAQALIEGLRAGTVSSSRVTVKPSAP